MHQESSEVDITAQCDVQHTAPEDLSEVTRKQEARARSLANLRPCKPGEIRNPRGRPKKDVDLAKLAQSHAETAVKTLVDVMTAEEATPSARVSAASELLDRGFGRAPQSLDVKHELSFSEQFEDFIMSISSRRSAPMIDVQASDAAE